MFFFLEVFYETLLNLSCYMYVLCNVFSIKSNTILRSFIFYSIVVDIFWYLIKLKMFQAVFDYVKFLAYNKSILC